MSPSLRLDQPKGEYQIQDLTSEVFVYGGPHPDGSEEPLSCPPSTLITFWGGLSYFLGMKMGRGRELPHLIMSILLIKLKFQEKTSSDLNSRLMENNLMTLFPKTNLWSIWKTILALDNMKMDYTNSSLLRITEAYTLLQTQNILEVATINLLTAPKECQKIRLHFVFDVKHCGKFMARLAADQHLTKDPNETVYPGVVSLRNL